MVLRINFSSVLFACIVAISVLGIWHLGIASKVYAKAWLADQLIERAWERTLNGEQNVRPWPWADTWPVAVLRLPRLGIRQIILAGDSGRTLAFGPGFTQSTALPGELGLSLISGHRDTHFRFLKDIKVGDKMYIDRPSKQLSYSIEETAVVDQRSFQLKQPVLSDAQIKSLILVTCYPFDALKAGGDLRFMVLATAI